MNMIPPTPPAISDPTELDAASNLRASCEAMLPEPWLRRAVAAGEDTPDRLLSQAESQQWLEHLLARRKAATDPSAHAASEEVDAEGVDEATAAMQARLDADPELRARFLRLALAAENDKILSVEDTEHWLAAMKTRLLSRCSHDANMLSAGKQEIDIASYGVPDPNDPRSGLPLDPAMRECLLRLAIEAENDPEDELLSAEETRKWLDARLARHKATADLSAGDTPEAEANAEDDRAATQARLDADPELRASLITLLEETRNAHILTADETAKWLAGLKAQQMSRSA